MFVSDNASNNDTLASSLQRHVSMSRGLFDGRRHPSANSGCYHSTMVDYSRAGRAGSAGSAGRNLNVSGSLW